MSDCICDRFMTTAELAEIDPECPKHGQVPKLEARIAELILDRDAGVAHLAKAEARIAELEAELVTEIGEGTQLRLKLERVKQRFLEMEGYRDDMRRERDEARRIAALAAKHRAWVPQEVLDAVESWEGTDDG